MMDREILIVISSFVFGILVSSFVFISPLVSIFILIVGLAIIISDRQKEALFISLALISFSLGCLRYSVKDFHEPVTPSATGVVVSEPEQRENATRFVMLADNNEKFLVSTGLYSPVQYGDKVKVEGKLSVPGIIENEDAGRPFDYGAYLSKDDIYHTMSFASVEVLSSGHGNPVKQTLFNIKGSFTSKIREILAEPHASLLSGLLVSGRDAMPKEILEEFRRSGIIHIVVLSGYNITIIAEFIKNISKSSALSILGVLLFVIMTGGEATVVRAALMALTVVLAKMLGRRFSAPRALLVAGFIMLLENPKILIFDPSFQLSFLATCGLIFVAPFLEKPLRRVPERLGLRAMVIATLATQATVLPLLTYLMGDVSLVSLAANLLVLLVIPATMLIGFLAATLSYLSSALAWPLAYLSHILLSWILGVSSFLGNLSFATIAVPAFSAWLVLLVYLLMIIFLLRSRNSLQRSAS